MKNFSHILFLLLLASCEQPTDWELTSGVNNHPVVEAILTDELKTQKIRLTRSFNELNETPSTITDAIVAVTANQRTFTFLHDDSNPGVYKSELPFRVFRNLNYDLKIEIDEEIYIAESQLSTVAPMPEIRFRKYRDSDSLVFANFVSPFNPNQDAMYQMDVDWSHLSSDSLTQARVFFYTFSSIDISELVPPVAEEVPFPKGSIVKAKKYGLNEDFARYLRALAIETRWNGALFYSSGSDLPTNISNGGLGFFSTCAVVEETVIAK